jgi:putative Mg2+ transporter-C (MgtC) family protein
MELNFITSLVTALALGLAIGIEREWRQHPAGLRTNALVAVGAALYVSLSRLMHNEENRIAAQVVSGIGFLGAGVIMREGINITGLTTAATLWCSAAVGVLSGAGYIVHAAAGTVCILLINSLLPLSRWIDRHAKGGPPGETSYRVRVACDHEQENPIRAIIRRYVDEHRYLTIQGISTHSAMEPKQRLIVVELYSSLADDHALGEIITRINLEPGVTSASWERLRA